jgi:hypothetical protein
VEVRSLVPVADERSRCYSPTQLLAPTALSFERPLLRELTPLLLRWWLVYFVIILEAIEFFFQLGNLRRILRIIIGIVHFRRVPFQVVEFPFFAARHIHAIEANELVALDLGSRAGRYELAKLSEYAKRVLAWLFRFALADY